MFRSMVSMACNRKPLRMQIRRFLQISALKCYRNLSRELQNCVILTDYFNLEAITFIPMEVWSCSQMKRSQSSYTFNLFEFDLTVHRNSFLLVLTIRRLSRPFECRFPLCYKMWLNNTRRNKAMDLMNRKLTKSGKINRRTENEFDFWRLEGGKESRDWTEDKNEKRDYGTCSNNESGKHNEQISDEKQREDHLKKIKWSKMSTIPKGPLDS